MQCCSTACARGIPPSIRRENARESASTVRGRGWRGARCLQRPPAAAFAAVNARTRGRENIFEMLYQGQGVARAVHQTS